MVKYNTKKRIFETILVNFPVKSTKFNINIENTSILATYENNTHIGYHIRSNTKYVNCKRCNIQLKRNKGYNNIIMNYGSLNSKIILVKLNLKKYHCLKCKTTTIDNLIDRKGNMQSTNEVINSIIKELSNDSTYTSVSKRFGESVTNIITRFDRYTNNQTKPKEKISVEAIGVDEVSMIKSNNNKYQFVVIDHLTNKIIDIIDGRKKADVLELINSKYLSVNYVTMDLWKTYRDAFLNEFNNVTVIADRFHVVRIFMWAFSKSRIRLFKENNIGTTKYWKILTCRQSKLDDKGLERLNNILDNIPKLKVLHTAKELAFDVFKHQSVIEFNEKLRILRKYVYDNKLKEYYKALKTVDYWYTEICNMFTYQQYSNGKSERINTSLKRMKSLSYGFKNKERTFKLAKHKINKVA